MGGMAILPELPTEETEATSRIIDRSEMFRALAVAMDRYRRIANATLGDLAVFAVAPFDGALIPSYREVSELRKKSFLFMWLAQDCVAFSRHVETAQFLDVLVPRFLQLTTYDDGSGEEPHRSLRQEFERAWPSLLAKWEALFFDPKKAPLFGTVNVEVGKPLSEAMRHVFEREGMSIAK